jgi:nucleoporin NUP42
MDGRISSFKNKPVTYKGDAPGIRTFDGTWTRIWFPDGPPAHNKDTELLPEEYDEMSRSLWAAFAQKGEFVDGIMPELPPPRECTNWDF